MKLKVALIISLLSVFAVFGGTPGPITICDVAHAQGYALSPNGDFEYYQFIPTPTVRGKYILKVSITLGASWSSVGPVTRFRGGEAPEELWYIPGPGNPFWYSWFTYP